jgi:hypothetical protein
MVPNAPRSHRDQEQGQQRYGKQHPGIDLNSDAPDVPIVRFFLPNHTTGLKWLGRASRLAVPPDLPVWLMRGRPASRFRR